MKEKIEQLAKEFAGSNYLKAHQPKTWDDRYRGFIAGYTAALAESEQTKQQGKWSDEDMRKCWDAARSIEDDTIWKGEFDNYMSLKFNYHPLDESNPNSPTLPLK